MGRQEETIRSSGKPWVCDSYHGYTFCVWLSSVTNTTKIMGMDLLNKGGTGTYQWSLFPNPELSLGRLGKRFLDGGAAGTPANGTLDAVLSPSPTCVWQTRVNLMPQWLTQFH